MKYTHILRCSLTALGLLAFAASMFCPVYGIETRTESRIYTCGEVLLEGVVEFPKDVARLVVTGETHYRMVWLLLDLLLFSSAYSVLRGRAGRKTHVAMFIAVITIICFYLWSPDYGWAWDWSEGTMTRKLYGYHLWLAGFVSVYAAVALERYCRGKEETGRAPKTDMKDNRIN